MRSKRFYSPEMYKSNEQQGRLKILGYSRGRALLLGRDGHRYISRRLAIFRIDDEGKNLDFVTRIPSAGVKTYVGRLRLGARLLRQEVRTCGVLPGGAVVAANRQWLYVAKPGEPVMRRARIDKAGQRLFPPMCIYIGPGARVIWSEYDSSDAHGKPMRVFVSEDGGESYEVGYVFEGGSIRHVHNFYFDALLRKYWVFAGDVRHEPGIGLLSEDLTDFEWVVKGSQKYRTVDVFDFGDRLVYGTDSELEPNAIVSMDKCTGKVDRLQEIGGSCIYSCKFGDVYALTTSVEPSKVNLDRRASLWLSRDGENWHLCLSVYKDIFPARYFQFGSLVLPRGESESSSILFSGQAVRGLDERIVLARWSESSE